MEDNERGYLYLNISIGTLGLIIIALALLKFKETVPGVESAFALLGYPLAMIYLHYLEKRAGISKRVIWIRSFIAILLLLVLAFIFFK